MLARRRPSPDSGASVVEYGLLVSATIVGCIGVIALVGNVAHTVLNSESTCISSSVGCSEPGVVPAMDDASVSSVEATP